MSVFSLIGGFLSSQWAEFLSMIASVLPQAGATSLNFVSAMDKVMNYGYQMSFIIDWNVLFSCLAVIVILEFSLQALRFGLWLMGLMRGGH